MPNPPTFLVNPAAGGGRAAGWWRRHEKEIVQAFPAAKVLQTTSLQGATKLTQEVVAAGSEFVVAVGGDGTANEVLNGLWDASAGQFALVKMGILPAGTGSDFARGLGTLDFTTALKQLQSSQSSPLYVGHAQHADASRFFLNACTFGFGARVVHQMGSGGGKRWLGRLSYQLWALYSAIEWMSPHIQLDVDGCPSAPQKTFLGAVCNGPFFGGGLPAAPGQCPISEGLQLLLGGDLGRIEALLLMASAGKRGSFRHPKIRTERIERGLVVHKGPESSSPIPMELDGEAWGFLVGPLRIHGQRGPHLAGNYSSP